MTDRAATLQTLHEPGRAVSAELKLAAARAGDGLLFVVDVGAIVWLVGWPGRSAIWLQSEMRAAGARISRWEGAWGQPCLEPRAAGRP